MTNEAPPAGTDSARIGLGRSNVVVALAVTGFLCWIIWAGAHGAWTSTDESAQILGYGIAALFAVPLVMMLRFLPRFLSPRYVVFDHVGLRILHGRQQVLVPWQEVAGFGIAFQLAPQEHLKLPTSEDEVKDMIKTYLADKASEALHVSKKRKLALEIFPVRPEASEQFPKLEPYWRAVPQQPPKPGLPTQWWSFPLPPVVSIAQAIAEGGQRFRRDRWIGLFARPWS